MSDFTANFRYAARTLLRSPGFTITAVVAIALGIGAYTAIFLVVNKVLLEPLPYPEPGCLVQLISSSPLGDQYVVSIPKYITWRDNTHDSSTWPHMRSTVRASLSRRATLANR